MATPAKPSTEDVLVSRRGPVLVITLNRPRVRNAATLPMAHAVGRALDEFDASDDLMVAVLTGAGGSFCVGMDLKVFTATGERPSPPGRGFLGFCERPPAKPLIAAVEGYALAGGCEAALASDLVVAASDAQFGLPEVKRGLVAAAGGLLRLPARIPPNIAMEWALTGDSVHAQRAYEVGLVNQLVEPGQTLTAALKLAGRIGRNGPLAVRTTKTIMVEGGQWSVADRFERQRQYVDPVMASDDAREGARAFTEKREPRWQSG